VKELSYHQRTLQVGSWKDWEYRSSRYWRGLDLRLVILVGLQIFFCVLVISLCLFWLGTFCYEWWYGLKNKYAVRSSVFNFISSPLCQTLSKTCVRSMKTAVMCCLFSNPCTIISDMHCIWWHVECCVLKPNRDDTGHWYFVRIHLLLLLGFRFVVPCQLLWWSMIRSSSRQRPRTFQH